MNKLLKKELRLTAAPITYFFLAFALMTLIPGYPILVGGFFITLGIFYTFQMARESNDILYTALLPCKKQDVVRAKYTFCVLIELPGWLLCAVLTAVRLTALREAAVYTKNAMMNANFAYLGWLLILFALFNSVFLGGFFRTAYGLGKPFILYSIAGFAVICLAEALHHFPGMAAMNSQTEGFGMQLIVLVAGVLLSSPCLTAFSSAGFSARPMGWASPLSCIASPGLRSSAWRKRCTISPAWRR